MLSHVTIDAKWGMMPKQIKALRKKLGLTQQELADSIGAQRVTIARWENGSSRPTGAYLMLLLKVSEKAKEKTRR